MTGRNLAILLDRRPKESDLADCERQVSALVIKRWAMFVEKR